MAMKYSALAIAVACLHSAHVLGVYHYGDNQVQSSCGKNLIPELTFQLGGNNLQWPCESTKNIYVQSGRYVPRNVIVTRVQIQKDIAYVALPRYKQGVPITLGKVQLRKGQCITPIQPFPCWAIQEEGNCQALQNVVDIVVDKNVSEI